MNDPAQSSTDREFQSLLEYLERTRGFDFTGYKQPSLMRRIRKRMDTLKVAKYEDYVDYLQVHPDEFHALFNTILINVTEFFRDPPAWEFFAREVVPRIIADRKPAQSIRVWSAGCASGQETYTLAMVFAEAMGLEAFQKRVKIYATDVDEQALAQARLASYTEAEVETLPADLKKKYFVPSGARYTFRSDLRRAVIFGRLDLLQDAPISRLDLLVCRNTLMYFNAEAQNTILTRFHFALNENGILFLGKAELMLTHSDLFSPLDLRSRLFVRIPKLVLRERWPAAGPSENAEAGNLARPATPPARLRDLVFDQSNDAQIVVDVERKLILASERARTLFGTRTQDLGRPLQGLELSNRLPSLAALVERALAERVPVWQPDLSYQTTDGKLVYFDMVATPLQESPNTWLGVSLIFTEVTRYHDLKSELDRSNQDYKKASAEYQTSADQLQSSNEELETMNEELQSTNEELETTNEELQSANEELETTNEELQSTNEELSTMNQELHDRTYQVARVNAALESILKGIQTGIIIVDRDLRIETWSDKSEDQWGLKAADALQKNFLSLDIGLPVEKLRAALLGCVNGTADHAEISVDAVNRRGQPMRCKVACRPLFNPDKSIRGAILMVEELRGPDDQR